MADSVGAGTAAVAAPSKSIAPPPPPAPSPVSPAAAPGTFVFTGRAGGPFNIDGAGFGVVPGVVTVGNRVVPTTRWIDRSIKGVLPKDTKYGVVTVQYDEGSQTGEFKGPADAGA